MIFSVKNCPYRWGGRGCGKADVRPCRGVQGSRWDPVRGCQSEISDESVVYNKVVPVVALLSQLFDGEHGHGFIEATSINDAGYSVEYFALEIEIILSSNDCRITSSTFLENSGNSSKWKDLPHFYASTSSTKATETSAIFTMETFTTTKILIILARTNNNDDICNHSMVGTCLSMVAGCYQEQ